MKTYLLTGLMALAPLAAQADPGGHFEQRQNIREQRDDRRDERQLRDLLSDFERASAWRDFRGLRIADARLASAIEAEINETERELRSDKREIRNSRYEPRSERRDDWRDLQAERRTVSQLKQMKYRFNGLRGRLDYSALQSKQELIHQLIALENREQRENYREQREDRRDGPHYTRR